MKKIVEMHFCDVCGCEVNSKNRHMISIGTYDSWDYAAEVTERSDKDLCPDCYKILLDLLRVPKAQDESKDKIACTKKERGQYDKEEIKRLWANGLTYRGIAERTGTTVGIVNNVIYRMTETEKEQVLEKYGAKKCYIPKETKRMKVITDEYGFVQSIEES